MRTARCWTGSIKPRSVYRGDLSLKDDVDLSKARYFDIGVFHIKQGHGEEFEATVKKVSAAFEKANPGAHWATYQVAYGQPDGMYLFITLRRSASEIDDDYSHYKDFASGNGRRRHETARRISGPFHRIE